MRLEGLKTGNEREGSPDSTEALGRVQASFDAVSPEIFARFNENVTSRLVFIEEHSKFNLDSRLIELGIKNVLLEIARRNEDYELTEELLAEARIAALIHDIGKSGPAGANKEQQVSVVRLFAREDLTNPNQTVEDGVRETFGEETNLMLFNLERAGVDLSMTMKSFWESHARWGYEIISREFPDLSEKTKTIAIMHHVDKGPDFNFLNMSVDQVPKEALVLGRLKDYVDVLRQRAIIALDQYEARTRRGKVSHEEAVSWVRGNVSKSFGQDAFMNQILDVMLEMGRDRIFPNIEEKALNETTPGS